MQQGYKGTVPYYEFDELVKEEPQGEVDTYI
jgi:hypothetical protein